MIGRRSLWCPPRTTHHSNKPSKNNPPQQQEEIQAVYDDILEEYETRALETIQPDGFGAMDTCPENARDGYYLIKWVGTPYKLTVPKHVEGSREMMPPGTFVCRGRYLDELPRCPHWYQYNRTAPMKLFRLAFIVVGDIPVIPYGQDGIKPRPWPNTVKMTEKQREEKVKFVPREYQEKIKHESKSRDEMDYLEVEFTVDETEQEEEDQIDE